MKEHMEILTLVNRHQLLPLFLARVDVLLPPAFAEVKGERMPFPKENIQYALTFSSSGFMHILIRWLNEGSQKSLEEMAAVVKDFIAICNDPNY